MKHTERRNFLFILAVVAHVSASPSTAAVALEKPIIKLFSPNGGLVWVSGHAEVTRGHSLIFNCSFNSSDSPGSFILKFSSQDISKNWTSQSNSFNFNVSEYDHEGNYSCVHKGNRDASDPIYVIIKYPLLNLLIYSVVPGSVLLLLVVVLIVVLVCRRRRRDRRPEGVILTETAVGNGSNDEEEEENDYINVDPGDNNRKSKPVGNEKDRDGNDSENLEDEDHDYENPEDDNDYENPEDEVDNVKATKAAVTAKKQREEDSDEVESSGDEHDYVNLAESISEQTLDIYEGQQDIYQNT